jgi:hypothetical protein
MQADPFTDDARRDHVAFDELADHENPRHPGHPAPVAKLQQRHQQGQRQAQTDSEKRYEGQQSGENADRQGIVEPNRPQRNGVIQRKDGHDRQLPAHELADHRVHRTCYAGDTPRPVARHQRGDARHHHVPVLQQIKHHHRNQQQVDHHAQDGKRTGLQGGQPAVAAFSGLFGHPAFERIEVGGDGDAEGLLQPGQEAGLQQVEEGRKALVQLGKLALKQGQGNQDQAKNREARQHDHRNGSGNARPPVPFQPIDQRIEHVGQQGTGEEGRENGSQQVDQPTRDEQEEEREPGQVDRAGSRHRR